MQFAAAFGLSFWLTVIYACAGEKTKKIFAAHLT
jgi:hypothetical protein